MKSLHQIKVEIYPTCYWDHVICFGSSNGSICEASDLKLTPVIYIYIYTKYCTLQGDSGSPLTIDGIVIGVNSFLSASCGPSNASYPNGAVNVSSVYNWIANIADINPN